MTGKPSGQSDAAAERSAHVVRGAAEGAAPRLITEWKGEDGRIYAALTGYIEKDRRIAELEAEVAALRAALEAGRGVEPRQSEVMSLDGPPGLPAAPGR